MKHPKLSAAGTDLARLCAVGRRGRNLAITRMIGSGGLGITQVILSGRARHILRDLEDAPLIAADPTGWR